MGFQSTSPVWRTTERRCGMGNAINISIHVPRVEDDSILRMRLKRGRHFNPRPPCGGRRTRVSRELNAIQFQSTSPVWRTTGCGAVCCGCGCYFNPRPPCGGRLLMDAFFNPENYFNPRPPCGGRLRSGRRSQTPTAISIHVPRV